MSVEVTQTRSIEDEPQISPHPYLLIELKEYTDDEDGTMDVEATISTNGIFNAKDNDRVDQLYALLEQLLRSM